MGRAARIGAMFVLLLATNVAACSLFTELDGLAGGTFHAHGDSGPDASTTDGEPNPNEPRGAAAGHAYDAPVVLATGQPLPRGIVTDASSVYFALESGNAIGAVSKAPGGPVKLLGAGVVTPVELTSDSENLWGTSRSVGCFSGSPPALFRISKTDGTRQAMTHFCYAVYRLAVDAVNVYATGRDTAGVGVREVAKSGTSKSFYPFSSPGALAASKGVLFAVTGKDIVAYTRPSGPTIQIASAEADPSDLVVDDTNVYWVNAGGGTVKAAPREGGIVTTLASGLAAPTRLALYAGRITFFESDSGRIAEVPVSGGTVTEVARDQSAFAIAADAGGVYWTDSSAGNILMARRRAR